MTDLVAEAATALDLGHRKRQEDAVIADFPQGEGFGLAVLSDGMGGHADGDLASRTIAGEMFGELLFAAARLGDLGPASHAAFGAALERANDRLEQQIAQGAISADTGGTLLAAAIKGDRLRWISVGDSLLYLYRRGRLTRLNADHSMAPQLDLMAKLGEIDEDTARRHPDRNCLTSAITGAPVPRIDNPAKALRLRPGDTVVLASDGLQTLSERRLARILRLRPWHGSDAIARALMGAVRKSGVEGQIGRASCRERC